MPLVPLSQADVDALPDGAAIRVTWSGGNGPHSYVLRRQFSAPWAYSERGVAVGHLTQVGNHPRDQVWVDDEGGDS